MHIGPCQSIKAPARCCRRRAEIAAVLVGWEETAGSRLAPTPRTGLVDTDIQRPRGGGRASSTCSRRRHVHAPHGQLQPMVQV